MKRHLLNSILMTAVLAILLGVIYPLGITAISQLFFRDKANGQLILKEGQVIGSRIIGQPFTGPGYFHSRPSAAGSGYDAANSSGSNLGPTNAQLISRINAAAVNTATDGDIPIDLVSASGSGLDPDITVAAANYQLKRVAKERGLSQPEVEALIASHTKSRQFGVLGEPRINVMELNLALDEKARR